METLSNVARPAGFDHTKRKAMSPQTNGICERLHKTILHVFYQITLRKTLCSDLDSS